MREFVETEREYVRRLEIALEVSLIRSKKEPAAAILWLEGESALSTTLAS